MSNQRYCDCPAYLERGKEIERLTAERDRLVHEMEGLRRKLDEALLERDAMGAERDRLRDSLSEALAQADADLDKIEALRAFS